MLHAALYFPLIAVPKSAWLTRTLLYWDQLGSVVPDSFTHEPEQHLSPYMLDLVRRELVRQVLPSEVLPDTFRHRFSSYIDQLDQREIERRRAQFQKGSTVRIHPDKFLQYGTGLAFLEKVGLVSSRPNAWLIVESRTGLEFMAALAISLCSSEALWQRTAQGEPMSWIPITDKEKSASAMAAGLRPAAAPSDIMATRVQGHVRTDEVRLTLLKRLLPVPEGEVPSEAIVRFRHRHRDLLPQLRLDLETRVDAVVEQADPVMRMRLLDRIEDEFDERVKDAEAYMQESFKRRIAKSSVGRFSRLVPVAGKLTRVMQEQARATLSQAEFQKEPLAYLAFARHEFVSVPSYRVDPLTGIPLADAMTHATSSASS